MRTMAVLIVLILLMASANYLWSQQNAANTETIQNADSSPVTMVLKDTPLPAAMAALFKGTGLSYSFIQIKGEVQGSEWWNKVTVSVNISNVPFRDAVKIVARAAGLNIKIKTQWMSSVTTQKATDSKDTSKSVSLQTEPDYLFTPSPQSSNQIFNRSQSQQAIIESGKQLQVPQNSMFNTNAIRMTTRDIKGGKLLSVQLEQANVFDVISQLMSIYKKDYILDLGPSAELNSIAPRVTARMSGVTLDEFLSMLKSSSGIQVEEKGAQTIVRWRPEPKAILAIAPLTKAYTVYYLYLLVDSNTDTNIRNILTSLEDGPALSDGNIEYISWLREKQGLESAKILIAGSVSNINALLSSQTNNARNAQLSNNILSVRMGPVTMDGMEFKASLFAQISVRSNLESKVHMTLADRLYWRQTGAIGDTRSSADRVVQWPINRTRLVRSESITWPNGSRRLFVLVASVSPVSSQDMWTIPSDK